MYTEELQDLILSGVKWELSEKSTIGLQTPPAAQPQNTWGGCSTNCADTNNINRHSDCHGGAPGGYGRTVSYDCRI